MDFVYNNKNCDKMDNAIKKGATQGGEITSANIKKEEANAVYIADVESQISSDVESQISSFTSPGDPLLAEPGQRRRRKVSEPKPESSEERAARLAKMSAYAARRLANESPAQRANRLRRMSEYSSRRLSQETKEQRAVRLSRMSAYAAKRLANETPEQRAIRLARMSEYAARRHAKKKSIVNGDTSLDENDVTLYIFSLEDKE